MRKWLCCVSVVFCLGQVLDTPILVQEQGIEIQESTLIAEYDKKPNKRRNKDLVLDHRCPDRDNYYGCIYLNGCLKKPGNVEFHHIQQRVTIGREGYLAKIDIYSGGGEPRNPCWTTVRFGVSKGEPWVYEEDYNERLTYFTSLQTFGYQFHWDGVDLSHLDWYLYPGDQITIHVELLEDTCIGYNNFTPLYEDGEAWVNGELWGRGSDLDLSFRVWSFK